MEYVEAVMANPSGGVLAAEFDLVGRSLRGDGMLYGDWLDAAMRELDAGGCTTLVLTYHRHYPGDSCGTS